MPMTTTVSNKLMIAEELLLMPKIDGGELLPGFSTPVWRLFRRRR